MKGKPSSFSHRYGRALRKHLNQGRRANMDSAQSLRGEALAAGLQTADLAKLHEQTLVTEILPGCALPRQAALIQQAGVFFAAVIAPIETTQRGSRETTAQLKKIIETLSRRTVELADSNLKLKLEINQRMQVEQALKQSERHYSELLGKSDSLQKQLRQLSRQVLSAQEEERKKISRELHDVIAQTLTGINVRLAALKREAAVNTKGLDRNIARTQRLVERSVNIVHRFARELRPAVLDDLGLIPALHSFLKHFTTRTGVRTRLTAAAVVEQLDIAHRTVLYRIAQEALTNISRHAKATQAQVNIQKFNGDICMRIKDDGKGFSLAQLSSGETRKRLGLLGMRERVEMVGGTFDVESAPGRGTTVQVEIPFTPSRKRRRLKSRNSN